MTPCPSDPRRIRQYYREERNKPETGAALDHGLDCTVPLGKLSITAVLPAKPGVMCTGPAQTAIVNESKLRPGTHRIAPEASNVLVCSGLRLVGEGAQRGRPAGTLPTGTTGGNDNPF
jgi:hypothetical protein